MKNAGKHSDDLKQLFRRLMRDSKPDPRQPIEPLDALVRGAMSYDVSDDRAEAAIKAIGKEFVDLNELRVATDLEIHELLGVRYPAIEERVAMITQCLNDIFEREHTMSLDRLKTISKRDARQFLRELPTMQPFVEAYVMMMAFDGSAFPIDQEMLDYLIDEEILEEGTQIADAQKFVENHVKGEDIYDFYYVLRRAALADGRPRKKARS
jgi:endonuclease III